MTPASADPNSNSNALSASGRDRVVHNYVDRSQEPDPASSGDGGNEGMDHNFPVKLHYMLTNMEQDGQAHIISWQPHGRCFMVHDMREFVSSMLPLWFRQSKMASFQRQLNLYGFQRITQGRDKNAYYHEYFLRGRPLLAQKITRTKVKGRGARKASSPETEPRFYELPWMTDMQTLASDNTQRSANAAPAVASNATIDPTLMALASAAPAPSSAAAAASNPVLLAAAAAAPTPSLGEAMGMLNYSQALSTAHFLAAGGVHPFLPNSSQGGGETLLLPSSQQQQFDGSPNSAMLNSLLASLGGAGGTGSHIQAHNSRNYIPIAPAPVMGMGQYKILDPANYASFSNSLGNTLHGSSRGMEATYGTVLEALKAQHHCADGAANNTDTAPSNSQVPFSRPGPAPF